MNEVLNNIARKNTAYRSAKTKTREGLKRLQTRERERLESLENVVGFVLDGKHATLTDVARELGCSRDKAKAMADRARKRNIELMRGGTE